MPHTSPPGLRALNPPAPVPRGRGLRRVGPPRARAARVAGAVPAVLLTAAMLVLVAGAGALGRQMFAPDTAAARAAVERLRFVRPERPMVREERAQSAVRSSPAPSPASTANATADPPRRPSGPVVTGTPPLAAVVPPVSFSAPRVPAVPGRPVGALGANPWARRDVPPLGRPGTPAAVSPAWAGRLGDGRASAAVAAPLAPGQADSALAAAREQMRRVSLLGRPLDARAGRALAGRAAADLTPAERSAMALSVAADEIVRGANGTRVAPGGGGAIPLPGGGPSARRRARDRQVHAATMEMFARVEARRQHRADSLAWAADSARAALGTRPTIPAAPR